IESSTSCGFTGIGDQQIVTDTLKLQPLADNGGDTLTMALDSGSVAIDRGECSLAKDQRGVDRPQGGGCDVGAYERSSNDPVTPQVSGTPAGVDLILNWQHQHTKYEVWRSTIPYFTPGDTDAPFPIAVWLPPSAPGDPCSLSNDEITCTDAGVLSPGVLNIYIVRAFNSSNASADSNRLGVITFGLQPGGVNP
ncbi:MAG: hypothetical protein GY759_16430, partial [Chloroflexi bacterium]|nr:hypothetical protein [Chloroflexota bacterium]